MEEDGEVEDASIGGDEKEEVEDIGELMAEEDGQRGHIGFAVVLEIARIVRVKNGFREESDGDGVWDDICTHLVGNEQ